jgi:hypothetical protein
VLASIGFGDDEQPAIATALRNAITEAQWFSMLAAPPDVERIAPDTAVILVIFNGRENANGARCCHRAPFSKYVLVERHSRRQLCYFAYLGDDKRLLGNDA